jgi:hypothetical protein
MNFRKYFQTAWNSTLEYIAPLLVMTLAMIAASFLSLGILAPVAMAGYMHSILLMLREEREPNVKDIFSQMHLFFPLFGFGLIVFILVLIGISLLVIPGILIMIAISYCCLYMLPLMTDRNSRLLDAIKESYAMTTKGNMVDNLAVFIIFIGLLALGGTTFIGSLFTQPFATIFLISVYEEKTKTPDIIVEGSDDQVPEPDHNNKA